MNDLTTTREDALRNICTLWDVAIKSSWLFAHALRDALDTVCIGPDQRADFLTAVSTQTGVTVKRLQNIVSIARNPSSLLAEDMGLEVSFGETVAGLNQEQAEYYLSKVADGQIQTVAGLRRELWTARPSNGFAPTTVPPQPIIRQPVVITIYPTDTPEMAACRIWAAAPSRAHFLHQLCEQLHKLIDGATVQG